MVVQPPRVAVAATARMAAAKKMRRKLLQFFIESVVIVEKVLFVGLAVFEYGFAALAGILDKFRRSLGRSDGYAVGIINNETIEIFV